MPQVIRPRPEPSPRVVVPERVGYALRPELERATIPERVTMGAGAPPFAGELREEQSSPRFSTALGVGKMMTLATLRRPWLYVGFIVDPGNATRPEAPDRGIVAFLRILAGRMNGLTGPFIIPVFAPIGPPQAVVNVTVGAACELVVLNETGQGVKNIAGTIWGMGER